MQKRKAAPSLAKFHKQKRKEWVKEKRNGTMKND